MNKKKLLSIVLVLLIAVLGCVLYLFRIEEEVIEVNNTDDISNLENNDEYKELTDYYQENKAINKDYVGDLYFTSNLLHESFVQARSVYDDNGELYTFYTQNGSIVKNPDDYTGNDVYIWKYWKTGEYDYNNHGGSVFLDYRNELFDQNLIIYGHHFSVWNDETRSKAFTPLEQLLLEENYASNKELKLLLENEIRTYELWSVYEFNATDDGWYDKAQYWRYNYNYDDYSDSVDNDYYQNYIDFVKENRLYDTDVELTTSDKTLTLQTCISGHTGVLYEILVFKQVDVANIN